MCKVQKKLETSELLMPATVMHLKKVFCFFLNGLGSSTMQSFFITTQFLLQAKM